MSGSNVLSGNSLAILDEHPWLRDVVDVPQLTELVKSRLDLHALSMQTMEFRSQRVGMEDAVCSRKFIIVSRDGNILEECTGPNTEKGPPYGYYGGDGRFGDMLAIFLLRREAVDHNVGMAFIVDIIQGEVITEAGGTKTDRVFRVHVYEAKRGATVVHLSAARIFGLAIAKHLGWQPPVTGEGEGGNKETFLS